ncbi:MAG: type II toxin-antitoxin system RelE/ParE family toxin [Magnetococcales bacterium]|nr:type II toxin-antitoxin system RelE/ParE family toxin [Magnetococcales bacterium]
MGYQIQIRREAKRKLQTLPVNDRLRITEKIMELGRDPDDASLDVKPLINSPFWRLRVGGWRVVYDRQDELRIITVERVRSRGDVYK